MSNETNLPIGVPTDEEIQQWAHEDCDVKPTSFLTDNMQDAIHNKVSGAKWMLDRMLATSTTPPSDNAKQLYKALKEALPALEAAIPHGIHYMPGMFAPNPQFQIVEAARAALSAYEKGGEQ